MVSSSQKATLRETVDDGYGRDAVQKGSLQRLGPTGDIVMYTSHAIGEELIRQLQAIRREDGSFGVSTQDGTLYIDATSIARSALTAIGFFIVDEAVH